MKVWTCSPLKEHEGGSTNPTQLNMTCGGAGFFDRRLLNTPPKSDAEKPATPEHVQRRPRHRRRPTQSRRHGPASSRKKPGVEEGKDWQCGWELQTLLNQKGFACDVNEDYWTSNPGGSWLGCQWACRRWQCRPRDMDRPPVTRLGADRPTTREARNTNHP